MKYKREEFTLWHALNRQHHPLRRDLAESIEEARTGGYEEKCRLSWVLRGASEKLAYQTGGRAMSEEDIDTTERQALEVLQEGVDAGHGGSLFLAALIHLANGEADKAKTCSDKIKDCTDLSSDEKEDALDELKHFRPAFRRQAPAGGDTPDGSFYAGISGKGQPMYLAAEDAPAATFDQAMKGAAAFTAHGHNDWSVPTSSELFSIYQNGDMDLASSFNGKSAYWSQERGEPRVNDLASGYSEGGKKHQAQGIELPVRYIRFDQP